MENLYFSSIVTLLIYSFMLLNFDMVQFVMYLAKSQKTNLIGSLF